MYRYRFELPEEVGHVVLNPTDFEEVVDVNISKAVGGIKFARGERYGAFLAQRSGDVNRFNSIKKIIGSIRRKLISECAIYCIFEKRPGD